MIDREHVHTWDCSMHSMHYMHIVLHSWDFLLEDFACFVENIPSCTGGLPEAKPFTGLTLSGGMEVVWHTPEYCSTTPGHNIHAKVVHMTYIIRSTELWWLWIPLSASVLVSMLVGMGVVINLNITRPKQCLWHNFLCSYFSCNSVLRWCEDVPATPTARQTAAWMLTGVWKT